MKNSLMDVIVVGGGASGLMAGITAAKNGCKVLILEHNDAPGKKILATGNGRCNFTNLKQGLAYYRSESPAFVMPSLTTFSALDTIGFFESLGIMTTEKNGYCYPRTMQASAIRNVLLQEAKRLQITILCGVGIRKIEKKNSYFIFDTKSGTYKGKKCIIATGGKADPKSGSDGSGYIYVKQLGHSLTTIVPALVPLVSDAKWLKNVKGVRQDASVTLYINENIAVSDQGEVQFTDYGISGIPVFQISRFAAKALTEQNNVKVSIDFVPDHTPEELNKWILLQIDRCKSIGSLEEILSGIINQKIAAVIASNLPFDNQKFSSISAKQRIILAEQTVKQLKETTIIITDIKSFLQAQVTAGGISTTEINPLTMESKLVSNLYFAGEVIDVEGMCGGYNLQWAWSSGYVAGTNAAKP